MHTWGLPLPVKSGKVEISTVQCQCDLNQTPQKLNVWRDLWDNRQTFFIIWYTSSECISKGVGKLTEIFDVDWCISSEEETSKY